MSQLKVLEIEEIPVENIKPSPFQPRLIFELEDLRGSIIRYGIQDPLKVRKVGDNYELIDGERRWRIAQQEGIETVPCLILEYSDEEADALAWRFNTERKQYTLEERAKHFRKHQKEGLSGVAIGRIHGYSQLQVNRLLAIFQLPEKYQNFLWDGEFAYQKYEYLYDKGLLNIEAFPYGKDVLEFVDEAVLRRINQREFENIILGYLSELEKRQVEEARRVATKLKTSKAREDEVRKIVGEPEVKPPETPEELEKAAEVLIKEAKRRKTPEQINQENAEKAKKAFNRLSLNEAERLGIDVKSYSDQIAEIEACLEEKPVDALSDIKTLQRELKAEIKEAKRSQEEKEEKLREENIQKRIEEEAEQRARKIEEDEKKKIEEEARKKAQSEILAKPELIPEMYKEREDRFKELREMQARAGGASKIISKTIGEALLKTEEDIQKAKESENRVLMANFMMIGSIMKAIENGTVFCLDHQGEQHELLWSCGEPITETYRKLRERLGL